MTKKIEPPTELAITHRPRQHTDAFKRDAVRLLESRGSRTVDAVAAELQVAASQLYDWKKQVGSQVRGIESLEDEAKRLRAEVELLRKERDFLKKVTAFFAKEAK